MYVYFYLRHVQTMKTFCHLPLHERHHKLLIIYLNVYFALIISLLCQFYLLNLYLVFLARSTGIAHSWLFRIHPSKTGVTRHFQRLRRRFRPLVGPCATLLPLWQRLSPLRSPARRLFGLLR